MKLHYINVGVGRELTPRVFVLKLKEKCQIWMFIVFGKKSAVKHKV